MCVSSDHADFSGTVLYAGRCDHPDHGRIEVPGYQNTAVNLEPGPNSMVLHRPATGLTAGHFIPVGRDGCCFDNAEALRAKPLLLWYRPTDPDVLVLPALDSHTGDAPRADDWVHPNHWLLFGSDQGSPVDYSPTTRHKLRAFLPDAVLGVRYDYGRIPNGDFALSHDDLLSANLDRVLRVGPGATGGVPMTDFTRVG